MKNSSVLKSITVAALVLLGSFGARSQTNLPMLVSKATLRAYAVTTSRTVTEQMSAPSETGYTGTWGMTLSPTHPTSVDLLKAITGLVPSVSLLNMNDTVQTYYTVNNSDGDTLFYTIAENNPVLGKGGYYLPAAYAYLYMNSVIPIKFNHPLSSAEMIYVDPVTGQTTGSQYLQVIGNKLYFPVDSSGTGYLLTTDQNGNQTIYNLKQGGAIVSGTSLSQQTTQGAIDNLLSFTATPGVPITVQDQLYANQGVGDNRTYEIIVPGSAPTTNQVSFSISTTDGYTPLGYYVLPQGSLVPQMLSTQSTLSLTNGVWYVIPNWDPTQFQPIAPENYYYGGATTVVGSKE